MPSADLDQFHSPVAAWFRDVFHEPTVVQSQAWRAISAGENTLVVAPTGSGKTLAAFLWSLSELTRTGVLSHPSANEVDPQTPTRVLYISPLKALGVDVDRNLAAPLAGISRTAAAMGEDVAPVRVGVRSGDTPQSERAKLLRNPPEILITTPESLYLMLTSKAAGTLRGVDTVIVDEIHAVAGTKRGAHLALSLERLEMITGRAVQRIGLSATVNPVDAVASFLGGDRPVTVVNPAIRKDWDVQVRSVVPDFQDPPAAEDLDAARYEDPASEEQEGVDGKQGTAGVVEGGSGPAEDDGAGDEALIDEALVGPSLIGEGLGGASGLGSGARVASGVDKESALPQQKSVWPHVQHAIYQQVMANRATLVFVNSRRAAERLTGALNELWAEEHDPESIAAPTRRDPAQLMAQSTQVTGVPAVIARAHHGSVSKEERADIEAALKSGTLRCVVATSSLELGIDMGLVDHVVQVGAPPSVASAVQRCGRAGHTVGATSHATIYPLHKQDAEAATVITQRLYAGELEPLQIITNALDVLAQQTIAAAVQAQLGFTNPPADAEAGALTSENEEGQAPHGTLDVERWWRALRRAYSYAALPRDAFDGVIELISGHYPSTDFADLKPRVVYDPAAGTLQARPGAQRLAATSGGTIPDRGMFGVFLAAGEEGARRVGELDEEMVYESRVGDVFTLGASSWRITEINRDQVIVVPAAGHTGRLPFWVGDAAGRPVELGNAIGEHRRQWGSGTVGDLHAAPFICDNTRENLDGYYRDQKEATGILPDERTLLVERFRDEIGDWRVIVHSPYGRGVNAPWAMALGAVLQRETGIDAMAVAGDDGLVLRLPYSEEPPGADLLLGQFFREARPGAGEGAVQQGAVGDSAGDRKNIAGRGDGQPGELSEVVLADVMDNVGSSALFAGRFRECAARALLLPRRNPGKRQPLWQQRQRASQLLDVAREHPEFPIMVESMRECLHDVYQLDALVQLLKKLGVRGASSGVRVAEVTTEGPSAFAESLLFTYTSAFMYEGDSAERAAALAVDPALLAKLLGKSGEGLQLDPAVITRVVSAAQWLADGRQAGTAEQAIDMIRALGPLTREQVSQRLVPENREAVLAELAEFVPQRLAEVTFGGASRWAVVEDMPVLRDGLGVPVPPGVPADPAQVDDAIDQLVLRFMRHQGPVTPARVAAEFGLGAATAESLLKRWVGQRRLESGHFTAAGGESAAEQVTEYIDTGMLRRLRSATLAAARGAVEPVNPQTYAEFLVDWHGVGSSEREELGEVIEQLAGVALPTSAWETLVLPSRIPDYQPGDLDDLLATGEIILRGVGTAGTNDALVSLLPADIAPLLIDEPAEAPQLSMVATQLLEHMSGGGAFLAAELTRATGAAYQEVDDALWELFDCGLIAPDGFAALRARLMSGKQSGATAHRAPRRNRGRGSARRLRMGRSSFAQMAGNESMDRIRQRRQAMNAHQSVPGRWAALAPLLEIDVTDAERALARSEAWIDRYGVVTRGAVMAEHHAGGFAEAYRTLSAWEDSGAVLRGYVIEGLGGAQFAPHAVIRQLRQLEDHGSNLQTAGAPASRAGDGPVLLAAGDVANPYGAALPWPSLDGEPARLTRGAGAFVVLDRGRLVAHLTRGGRTLTAFDAPSMADNVPPGAISQPTIDAIIVALSSTIRAGRLSPVTIDRINGASVMDLPTQGWIAAGARLTPKGLSIRG